LEKLPDFKILKTYVIFKTLARYEKCATIFLCVCPFLFWCLQRQSKKERAFLFPHVTPSPNSQIPLQSAKITPPYWKGGGIMGMTDRQFDEFLAQMLIILRAALEETPDNKKLKAYIEHLETSLKRP